MDNIESEFPRLRLTYMPEFLREKDAVEWFADPDRIVISGENDDMEIALSCFDWVPESIPRLRMKHLEAELGKLAHNAYIATKVTFTCEIERIATEFGVDPYPIMESVWTDRRVRNSAHLTPGLGGFDGKCVPKDTAALSSVDKDPNSVLKILEERGSKKAVERRNMNRISEE
jgi:UDPglucose 6-dehydrogenase